MGFILRSISGAVGSAFRQGISCEDMGQEILMLHKTSENGIIANGSRYSVFPGQAAVFCNNGQVFGVATEPGVYEVVESSSPSLFDSSLKDVLKEIGDRITFKGATAKLQGVFFFNMKEIINNGFGTPAPVPYMDWDHAMLNARTGQYIYMSVKIKCFGKYTYKIEDPLRFMAEHAGSAKVLTKNDLNEQLRSEVVEMFTKILNSLGNKRIGVMTLPSQTDEIKRIIEESQFDEQFRKRGLRIINLVVESVTLDEESQKKIDLYEAGGDAFQQQGMLTQAALDAANNSAGAANGFVGLGMFGNMFGGNLGQVPPNPIPQAQPQPLNQPNQENAALQGQKGKTCTKCGATVTGKFCSECGTPVPVNKFCSNCGHEVKATAKFCSECGSPL